MFHRKSVHSAAPNGQGSTACDAPLQKGEHLHCFEDGDETIVVKTIEFSNGEYMAFDNDDSVPLVFGRGFSTIGAIANLFEKLPRAASEREERDDLATRFDHARDLRKHSEAV